MTHPVIYLCYGMPKSGSTLAFNLTRAAALRAGFDQSPVIADASGRKPNFIPRIPDLDLDALIARLQSEGREMVVIKTHSRPDPSVRRASTLGLLRVQAVCRDPRDVALSMRDAGRRDDAWGQVAPGQPIGDVEEVRVRLANQVHRFERWATMPGCLTLSYDEVAFATSRAARRIALHMGLPPAPRRDAWSAKSRFSQLNRGVPRRHVREMSAEQAADWYAEFGAFIDSRCDGLGQPDWGARATTMVARVLRVFFDRRRPTSAQDAEARHRDAM
ncbi:MAG: hypothetical protein AAF409_01930 [Pseudomonadota bacterium]